MIICHNEFTNCLKLLYNFKLSVKNTQMQWHKKSKNLEKLILSTFMFLEKISRCSLSTKYSNSVKSSFRTNCKVSHKCVFFLFPCLILRNLIETIKIWTEIFRPILHAWCVGEKKSEMLISKCSCNVPCSVGIYYVFFIFMLLWDFLFILYDLIIIFENF